VGESAHRSRSAGCTFARVVRRVAPGEPYSLDDGLGIRRIESDGRIQTEILALTPVLANHPVVEQAIRDRLARYEGLDIRSFASVRRLERSGALLNIVSQMPPGVRLSHLLTHLEATGEVVPESAVFELASQVINAVASLHAWPGGFAHGAVNPAHILIANDGRVLVTDCVFGAGLEALQRNREALWKQFRLAMPPAANLARFDQQADVTQMGAVVLALFLQRPLRPNEYPRGISDLVVAATESTPILGSPASSSALRRWLQEALQIHARVAFRSAVEAQRAFADVASSPDSRHAGAMALQVLMETTCAEPLAQPPVVVNGSMPSSPRSSASTGQTRDGRSRAIETSSPTRT
jgi:hypothetical protein